MPFALDDSARRALIAALDKLLVSANVSFGRYVDFDRETAENVFVRLRDAARKRKITPPWLTYRAVTEFLTDQLEARAISGLTRSEMSLALNEAFGLLDTSGLATELSEMITTLPWRYRLTLPLPFGRTSGDEYGRATIALSNEYRIETYDNATAMSIPLIWPVASEAHYRHRVHPSSIAVDTPYFVTETEGYIPATETSAVIDEFIHDWKGLIGLLSVEQILPHALLRQFGPPLPLMPILVHRVGDDGNLLPEPYKWLGLEDTRLLERFSSTDQLANELSTAVDLIRPAFAHLPTRSAARWYLDSLSQERGVLQIVQATISLEILLGDKDESDELGITALLANRLAFMTEHSPRRREEVMESFRRLYKIRSRIVHAGKASLADDERSALRDLQRLVLAAIHSHVAGLRSEAV